MDHKLSAERQKEIGLKTKSISITSGKGGVGKTSLAINLSQYLAMKGKKVLLIDCDFGLANIDVILNLKAERTLQDILTDSAKIEDVIINTKHGFDLLAASSGIPDIADLELKNQKYLIKHLAQIQQNYDILIFDTGSGIHKSTLRINAAADNVLVVTNPEPTSLTDAYSIIKALRNLYKVHKFQMVVMKADLSTARKVRDLIAKVAEDNGLLIDLELLGAIETDPVVTNAIYKRLTWREVQSDSNASKSLEKIVQTFLDPIQQNITTNKEPSFWAKYFKFVK